MKAALPRLALLLTSVAVSLLVMAVAEPAWAAPGGLIKQAARTTWGRIVLAGLLLFFAPLILWYLARRAFLVRRTRKTLRQLGRQLPHFDWLPLKERIGTVFMWVHSAWDQRKMQLAREQMTEWYVANQQLQLDKWQREGLRNVTSDVRIKSVTPLFVSHDPASTNPDRIVVEITAEMRDYLVREATSEVVEGDKSLGQATSVWSFVHEGGAWLLSNVEAEGQVMDYLAEPDRVALEPAQRTA